MGNSLYHYCIICHKPITKNIVHRSIRYKDGTIKNEYYCKECHSKLPPIITAVAENSTEQ